MRSAQAASLRSDPELATLPGTGGNLSVERGGNFAWNRHIGGEKHEKYPSLSLIHLGAEVTKHDVKFWVLYTLLPRNNRYNGCIFNGTQP